MGESIGNLTLLVNLALDFRKNRIVNGIGSAVAKLTLLKRLNLNMWRNSINDAEAQSLGDGIV